MQGVTTTAGVVERHDLAVFVMDVATDGWTVHYTHTPHEEARDAILCEHPELVGTL